MVRPCVLVNQSVEVDCEDHVVPPVKFFGAVRFEPKRSFLDTPRERRCSCAVVFWHIVVKPRRRKTTRTYYRFLKSRWNNELRCIGFGWLRSPISINQESEDNIELLPLYHVPCVTLCTVTVLSNNTHETTKKKKKKKKDCSQMSVHVPQSWPRWVHSVSHTRVTVERGIKFGIDQNRDAAANCWRLAPVTHAGRAASSPEIFWPFLTVCLTIFPLEFRPRTFTIGFYGKKSFISEL